MADMTPVLGLALPSQEDNYDIEDFNRNARIIDGALDSLGKRLEGQAQELLALGRLLAGQQLVVNDYGLRIKALEDGIYTDITGNPFSVRFNTLEGVQVTGVWNKDLQRMEC